MKKLFILFIFAFSFSAINAQSISVAPTSIDAWGGIEYMKSISFEYEEFGIHYFKAAYLDQWANIDGEQVYFGRHTSTLAISYIPINYKNIIRLGAIYSFNNFPTSLSNKFNFWVEAGIDFKLFRVSYVHISNGFGITNEINPGLDRITFTVKF